VEMLLDIICGKDNCIPCRDHLPAIDNIFDDALEVADVNEAQVKRWDLEGFLSLQRIVPL